MIRTFFLLITSRIIFELHNKKVMAEDKEQSGSEANDSNKKESHDPIKSGKEAIEADRQTNKSDKSKEQQVEEEKQDAQNWRNEG